MANVRVSISNKAKLIAAIKKTKEKAKLKPVEKESKKHSEETKDKISESMKYDREEVVEKFKTAFLLGLNDTEACLFAEVSRSFYYDVLLKERPELKDTFTELKENIKMQAKVNIANVIKNGDVDVSIWYVKNTDEEFNPKKKVEHSFDEDNAKRLQKFLAEDE